MAKIYYVGDWAVLTGPWFAETPFQNAMKGLDVFNYGTWLKEALESSGKHQVTSVPSWEFYKLGPGDYERVLADYDVIIFSDVEGKLFQVAPSFFDRAKFGHGVLTFPDRVRLTIDAVRQGKGLVLLGGWYSFTGELGKGGWGRTLLREAMPVVCLDHEDLVESTEGYHPVATPAGADRVRGARSLHVPAAARLQPGAAQAGRRAAAFDRGDRRPALGRVPRGPGGRALLHVGSAPTGRATWSSGTSTRSSGSAASRS